MGDDDVVKGLVTAPEAREPDFDDHGLALGCNAMLESTYGFGRTYLDECFVA